jgi:UDP-N-acetylmuramyl pentapeptide synthase
MVENSPPEVPVIVNGDDALLLSETKRRRERPITFAVEGPADFKPDRIDPDESTNETTVTIEGHRFRLALFGRYQVYNLLAAYAAIRTLGYSMETVDTEAINLETAAMRGEEVSRGGVTFVADCYNANPDSVASGLQSFAGRPHAGRKVIILGDMLELGPASEDYHRRAGRLAAQLDFGLLIFVGPLSAGACEAALGEGVPTTRAHHFETVAGVAAVMDGLLKEGDLVFVKGSRGVGLEALIESRPPEGGGN